MFLHPGLRFFRELTVKQHTVSTLFLGRIGFIYLTGIQQLNQMPAERGVNRLAGLAFLQAQQRVTERRIKDFRRGPAEVAALVRRTRIVRVLFSRRRKGGFATADIVSNLLQLRACLIVCQDRRWLQQNVTRMDFGDRDIFALATQVVHFQDVEAHTRAHRPDDIAFFGA
ncbi:Uncharacterised protein [Pantoea agglomerans]|uniref:Uncharacterized protein n=1 Tax=Enterobacter agglomerans TaxID=549 RepID=A0A379AKQ1_ENTAG|nr:Uncharacterised protein [Pantoea agglomerans]